MNMDSIDSYVRIEKYFYQQEENNIMVSDTTSNVVSIPLGIKKSYLEKSFQLTKISKMDQTILIYQIFLSTLGVYEEEFLVIQDLIFKKEAQDALNIPKVVSATIISDMLHNSVLAEVDSKAGAIIIPLHCFIPIPHPGDIIQIAVKVKAYDEKAEFFVNQKPIVKMRNELGEIEELRAIRLNGVKVIDPELKIDCVREVPKGSYSFNGDTIIYTITFCNTGNTQIQIPKGMIKNKIPEGTCFQCILKEPYKESFMHRHGFLYNTQELIIQPKNEGNDLVKISYMVKVTGRGR